jgi:hypothetical protein
MNVWKGETMKMKRLICWILGHKFSYQGELLDRRLRCERCKVLYVDS